MRLTLAFGKTGLPIDLPDSLNYRVFEARSARAITDPAAALDDALDRPIGCAPLTELARGRRSAAISVCDITRPAPNRLTLPPILHRLQAAGMPRDAITILVATGLHRPASAEEIVQILGREIAGDYRVLNHHARELSEHRLLGTTASGTPVYVDERFCAADLHITTGFIEPHLMAGFSGGRKLIVPGLAGQETIKTLHSPRFMRHDRAVEGSIDANPLHHELLEIAGMARHDFVVDVALTRERRIAGVFAGEPVAAHRRGVEFVAQVMSEFVDEAVDAAITTSAGYPLDLTFYQAVKGITAAAHIVRPGGRILLCAACDEGAGAAEFSRLLREGKTDREFLEEIQNSPVTIDQWQLEKLALVTRQFQTHFYVPGLPADMRPRSWGPFHDSPAQAIAAVCDSLKAGATVAVIPEGPYVLARLKSHGDQATGVAKS